MKSMFDVLEKAIKWVVVAILLVFTALVALQVISRYLFHSPITWSEQAARYLFIWTIMLYMPVLVRNKANIAFDLLLLRSPKQVQSAVAALTDIMIAVFAGYYAYNSIQLCLKAAGKTLVGIGLPQNIVYVAQPIGAILLLLVSLEALWNNLQRLQGRKEAGI